MTRPDRTDFMTMNETAEYLRVTTRTVQNWLGEGRFQSVKFGGRRLIFRPALEAWLRKQLKKGYVG